MDFLKKTEIILANDMINSDKIIALCDILIPKIMYIPLTQASVIQSSAIDFQSSLDPQSRSYFILQTLIALLEYRASNFNSAIELIKEIHKNISDQIEIEYKASSCVIVGISNRSLGQKELSLKYLQIAVEEYGKEPKLAHQQYLYGLSLYHIGEMFGEMNEYDEMLEKHLKFTDFGENIGNVDFINRGLNGIGRAYLGKKEFEKCLEYLKLADEKIKQAANLPFIARNQHDLGFTYFQMKEYEKSIHHYGKALEIRKANKYTNASITTLLGLSQVYTAKANFKTSIQLLEEAKAIAETFNVKRKIYQIYLELSLVYEQSKDFEKAFFYYKKFHELKEELDNVNKTQVENQKIREANTQLRQQKKLIETQKQKIETTVLKLKETNKYLESFASVAAHDLKAPIRIAASFSKLIERKYKTIFDDRDKEYFKFLTDNISLLAKMIDNLLSLSKLDKNLSDLEIVDTNEMLKIGMERLKDKVSTSKADILIKEKLPTVQAHETLIIQLFQNIIDNAIKHVSDNDVPKIIISVMNNENDKYHKFEIKDNGVGISKTQQPFIFELFSRADRHDSTGIGLATCKKIVTNYGGKIWVESELNQGTSIFFTLPSVN